MQVKKVFIQEDNRALLVCDECGETLSVDCTQFPGNSTITKVKCRCSAEFSVLCERRRYYRKSVELFGGVCKANGEKPTPDRMHEAEIQDMSRTGVSFKTSSNHGFKQGDYLSISFSLNDSAKSRITLNLVVKRVSGLEVGAEITTKEIPKTLAFYLLP